MSEDEDPDDVVDPQLLHQGRGAFLFKQVDLVTVGGREQLLRQVIRTVVVVRFPRGSRVDVVEELEEDFRLDVLHLNHSAPAVLEQVVT